MREEVIPITDYELISTRQINGFSVKTYAPILPEEERKSVVNELITNMLNEYNRLETEKKIAV